MPLFSTFVFLYIIVHVFQYWYFQFNSLECCFRNKPEDRLSHVAAHTALVKHSSLIRLLQLNLVCSLKYHFMLFFFLLFFFFYF